MLFVADRDVVMLPDVVSDIETEASTLTEGVRTLVTVELREAVLDTLKLDGVMDSVLLLLVLKLLDSVSLALVLKLVDSVWLMLSDALSVGDVVALALREAEDGADDVTVM